VTAAACGTSPDALPVRTSAAPAAQAATAPRTARDLRAVPAAPEPVRATRASSPAQEFSDCDPLVPEHCGFPFPNNFWLRDDASMPSGHRVHFGPDTLPKDKTGTGIDPTEWNELDGFSPIPAIMTWFKDVVLDNVPHHWDLAASLDPDCPTVLLDAETGERLPHFVELNESTDDSRHKAFMIWPLQRLKDSHRYIVALRDLEDSSGQLIAASSAFQALRDDVPTTNYDIEGRRATYEDIFAKLESAGVARDDLQLAWDFNTASRQNITGRLVAARDDALARVGAAGPKYHITSVTDEFSDHIYREIKGWYEVPLYLNTAMPEPGIRLVLDADDRPVFQGYAKARFTVLIPRSVVTNHQPGRIVQYGHGLFGDQGEVESGYLQDQADRYGYILAATDWWGMSQWDAVNVTWMMLRDISDFPIIPDRSTQGMVNALLLMRMMMGDFSRDASVTFDGVPVIDTDQRNYYGNSQGGILGGVYMAVSTDVQYGTLGVAGGPYGLLLPRSADFNPFYAILKGRYPNGLDQILGISIMQMLWDRAEPSGYIGSITSNPLPNTPVHRVLFQYGLSDAQVSYLGLYTMARSVGAVMFEGNVSEGAETLYGFPFISGSTSTKSVAVGYDFGMPDVPVINIPPDEENDTHEKPRRELTAQDQMNLFFRTGTIQAFCSGGCDPN
jgi:hypothetical protein